METKEELIINAILTPIESENGVFMPKDELRELLLNNKIDDVRFLIKLFKVYPKGSCEYLLLFFPEIWKEITLDKIEKIWLSFAGSWEALASFISFGNKYLKIDFYSMIIGDHRLDQKIKINLENIFSAQPGRLHTIDFDYEWGKKRGYDLKDFELIGKQIMRKT